MADGDHGCSYQDVRDINKLDSDNVPDNVLEKHLDRALDEVKKILRTDFSSSTPSFSNIVFNTRDLFKGEFGSILYFKDFKDYHYVQTITTVEYRSSDSSSYDTLTEGMESDYSIDTSVGAIKFWSFLSNDGINNLRVTGTYGYSISDMPTWIEQLVALIAALQGIVYVTGGSFTDITTHSIGGISVSKGQYATNLTEQYRIVRNLLNEHLDAHGVKLIRNVARLI